jgi:hypothetical protein
MGRQVRFLLLALVTGALWECMARPPAVAPTTASPKFVVRLDPAARKSIPAIPVWTFDPSEPNEVCPEPAMCAAWAAFRIAHGEPYQAMSVKTAGDESVVILSEPPPSVDPVSLTALVRSIFGADLLDLREFRYPIGINGWLGDVVLRVRNDDQSKASVFSGDTMAQWSAPAGVVDRLHMLYRFFYQTNDGFWIDNLNQIAVPQEAVPDLNISAAALSGWTSDDAATWIPLENVDARAPWKDVKASSSPAAFRLGNELIALVLPPGQPLSYAQGAFREFAVASDLLVGAVKTNDGNVVLFGRARTVPLAVLPPLRFETFENFADHRASELEQSYERNEIFAGRVTGERWDWAPILLSAQLDDTEAGTVLNLADHVLKSWSEHGYVHYYEFWHKKPATYPFGNIRASTYFAKRYGTNSLLYNWNTEKFSSTVDLTDRRILSTNRANALPVLYDPSSDLGGTPAANSKDNDAPLHADAQRKASEARDYFARLGDPILVRDVQNVILFQTAQHYLSTANAPTTEGRSQRIALVLQREAEQVIDDVLSSDSSADASLKRDIRSFMENADLNVHQFAELTVAPRQLIPRLERARKALFDAYSAACREAGGKIVNDKCRNPGTPSWLDQPSLLRAYLQVEALDPTALMGITTRLSRGTDNAPILESALEESAKMPTTGFIRTPSIVLSRDVANVFSVGGHNIYAETEELSAAVVEREPVPPIATTLETRSTGTLLEEMRALPLRRDMTAVLAAAKSCDCDALITQDPSGEITLVRNAPPPVERVISGKSGVLDALAPPPELGVIRFDHFDPQTIHDILSTRALFESQTQGSSLLDRLGNLFGAQRGKSQTQIEVLADADPRDPTIELTGAEHISRRITWSGESSEIVSATEFNRLFGLPADSGTGSSTLRVVVRFNSNGPNQAAGSNPADVLGVRATGVDTTNPGPVQRFMSIFNTWLGRQPKQVHVLEAARDLNRDLRESMPGVQQQLFLAKNAQSLKVSVETHEPTAEWTVAALP